MQDVGKVTKSSMKRGIGNITDEPKELWESVQQITTGWTVPGSNFGKGTVSLPE